jgi:hypothetical protein
LAAPISSSAFQIGNGLTGITALAAGRGMGMAKPANASSKNKSKNKSTTSPSSWSSSTTTTPIFNVNASLIRLEKRYEELQRAVAKAMASSDDDTSSETITTTEYIVAARALGHIDDWVPIAQLCVARPLQGDGQQKDNNEHSNNNNEYAAASSSSSSSSLLIHLVSQYCRELSQVAVIGSTRFQSIPRTLLQYAIEPETSFHKFVYDPVVKGNLEQVEGEIMTKAMAKQVLELEDLPDANGSTSQDDKSRLKSAYRKKSFQYHPDRFIGQDLSEEIASANAMEYSRVQRAYETLVSGAGGGTTGSSWYASLGGRARNEFRGPLDLIPIATAVESVIQQKVDSALIGLNPSIVQQFVARSHQLSSARK